MSLRIRSNATLVNAHRNLANNDTALTKTLEKLSSGLRVVRAADGPASLVISEQLRSQIGGIEQAIRNTETDITMVQTTESSLNEVNQMLTQLRQLAVHAANEGANDELMLQADQTEVDNILDAIDRVARDTEFGRKKVLDGSTGASGRATGEGLEFVKATEATTASNPEGYDVVLTQVGSRAQVIGEEELTDDMVQSGETIKIVQNGISIEYTGTVKDNVESMIQRLSSEAERAGLQINIELTGDKKVNISHLEYGSEHQFQTYSTSNGILSEEGGTFETIQNGDDVAGTINGQRGEGRGQYLTVGAGNRGTEGITVRYSGPAGEISSIDPEEGQFVGQVHVSQNSLRFQIGHNYDQNKSISLENTSSSSLAKGIDTVSGFKSLREINVTEFEKANDSLRLIEKAINDVSSVRGTLGAFQKNILDSNLSSMRISRENMISSESVIRDADIAEEMTNLTRQELLSKTSMAMLAQANQQTSKLMQLLD